MTGSTCVFCRIVAGDSPASIIWQDEEAMAHFLIVPQSDPNDITSRKFMRVVDGEIEFSEQHLPLIPRAVLDGMAAELAIDDPPTSLYHEPDPER